MHVVGQDKHTGQIVCGTRKRRTESVWDLGGEANSL